jgi:hypothetical protein
MMSNSLAILRLEEAAGGGPSRWRHVVGRARRLEPAALEDRNLRPPRAAGESKGQSRYWTKVTSVFAEAPAAWEGQQGGGSF